MLPSYLILKALRAAISEEEEFMRCLSVLAQQNCEHCSSSCPDAHFMLKYCFFVSLHPVLDNELIIQTGLSHIHSSAVCFWRFGILSVNPASGDEFLLNGCRVPAPHKHMQSLSLFHRGTDNLLLPEAGCFKERRWAVNCSVGP